MLTRGVSETHAILEKNFIPTVHVLPVQIIKRSQLMANHVKPMDAALRSLPQMLCAMLPHAQSILLLVQYLARKKNASLRPMLVILIPIKTKNQLGTMIMEHAFRNAQSMISLTPPRELAPHLH